MALDYPPFAPGSPVPASFLNDVRDHVNNHKHADVELLIPPTAMIAHYNSDALLHGMLYWYPAGIRSWVHCPLVLHAGTTVKAITIYGRDAQWAAFSASVFRRPLTTNQAPESIADGDKSSGRRDGPASITFDENDDGFPFLVQPAFAYTAMVYLDNMADVAVYGARVVIRRD